MTTTQLRPRVISNVRTTVSFVSPAGDKTAAMIGPAQWGPMDTATTLTNIGDFIGYFGPDNLAGLAGFRGADLFFKNGSSLTFVRIEDDAAVESDVTLLKEGGDLIDVTAKYKGTYGDNIKLTVTANSVTAANRDLVITDGLTSEVFNSAGQGYATTTLLMAAVNVSSNFVTMALADGGSGSDVPDAVEDYLENGDDGVSTLAIADYSAALADVLYSEDFQYIVIPGITTAADLVAFAAALDLRGLNENKYASLIAGVTADESITEVLAKTYPVTKNTRMVYPGVEYNETYGNTDVNLDGSYLACAVAGTLCSLSYAESGTHKTVVVQDLVVDSATNKKYLNKLEQERALQANLLPISLIGNSIQIVKDITTVGDSSSIYFSGTIVDIVDYATSTLETYLNTIIGLPNTSVNRSIWGSQCETILAQMVKDEILTSYDAVIVKEGTSSNMIDVEIGISPTYSVDFIYLTIAI